MRNALVLLAFSLGACSSTGEAERRTDAPLAQRIAGEWATADSVAYALVVDGVEVGEIDGRNAVLYRHLSLSDSTYTFTSVNRDNGALTGVEVTWRYRLEEGALTLEGKEPVPVEVRGDTLVLRPPGEDPYTYTRAAPLAPPEALLGDWITEPIADGAGVAVEVPFRFREDGTAWAGPSDEPLAYRVLGPYLLLEETTFEVQGGETVVTTFQVVQLPESGLAGESIVVLSSEDGAITLYRR